MATIGELRVEITGDTSGLGSAVDTAEGKLKSFGQSLTSVGQTLSTVFTAPLVGGAAAAVESFRSFDDAIAGVRKTVDA